MYAEDRGIGPRGFKNTHLRWRELHVHVHVHVHVTCACCTCTTHTSVGHTMERRPSELAIRQEVGVELYM